MANVNDSFQVLCLLSLRGLSTSLHSKMMTMEPWLPRTPSSIKMVDIELRPFRTLDKMATSTRTDIVLLACFTTSFATRHVVVVACWFCGHPIHPRELYLASLPMLPVWEDGTFHHSLQESPFQTCLQRSSLGFISDPWMELAARASVRPKDCSSTSCR